MFILPPYESGMRRGHLTGIIAFTLWGTLPLFWKALGFLEPSTIIAQRILWSLVLLLALALFHRARRHELADALRDPRRIAWLCVSAALLTANWLLYVWATLNGHVIEAALGYYLTPFLNMLFGRFFFGERHNRLQATAILLAAAGVALRFHAVEGVPWVALTLAGTFSTYSLVRKTSPLGTLPGLTGETILAAPLALGWLVLSAPSPAAAFGASPGHALLVAATGPATIIPLLCFVDAARKLRLSTLGILQFLAPTLQFLIGWQIFGEPLAPAALASFALIWLAVGLYAAGSRHPLHARESSDSP